LNDVVHLDDGEQSRDWRFLTRVAFRFCVLYVGLFCVLFPQILYVLTGAVSAAFPARTSMWQMIALAPVTEWVGRHVFGVDAILHPDSRSGDQTAMWVLMFIVLAAAIIGTAIWSALDSQRPHYRRAHAWFLAFVRLCLGGQMLLYGAGKLIPVQMPAPSLTALLRPFGQLDLTRH